MSEQKKFRHALGEFPTGVAVITAQSPDGELLGMTMSSFNSVSVDPPLVLFCVDRKALSLPAMEEAEGFAISILSRTQTNISNKFSRALDDKWNGVDYTPGYGGAPLLKGVLAHFECAPYAVYDGGDHCIFVARVVNYNVSEKKSNPLVFFRGSYRDLLDESVGM